MPRKNKKSSFFLPQALKTKLSRRRLKKLWRNKKFKKAFIFTFIGLGIIFVGTIAWFSKDLPTPSKIKQWRPALSTKILDRNGKLLYEVHGEEKRTWTEIKDIPENMQKATIAAEDKEFYHHFGINLKGLTRAFLRDVLHRSYKEGGSSITQQFVKNALLTPKRTLTRKIKEAILSIELEVLYSKEQILEMYLNTIPYGSNAYGVEAAAQTFFGKSAKDLNLAECALLASLPKAPTYYSPYGSHLDSLMARKNYVLDQMVDIQAISPEEAEKAKKTKISFKPYREQIFAPHFVMWIKEQLAQKYGQKILETGGLKVYTTLNWEIQQAAEEAVYEGAEKNKNRFGGENASLVAIDPKSGEILAMVGSKNYFEEEIQGRVNVALRPRQPGSSFKPIVYATLFKGQWAPGYTLFDLETDFGGSYKPHNYDHNQYGPVTIRFALANSLNISAVKALYLAGLDNVLATAKDLGITTLTEPERYGLSLVLGGGEVKLLELAGAYTAFAQKGRFAQPFGIIKVLDSSGKVLEENKPQVRQVLPEEIAYEIWDILSDTTARSAVFGWSKYMSLPDRKVALKTGTTDDFRDAWTIGFVPNLVAGVWAGNSDNRPMYNAPGSMAAAPIWHSFMTKVKDKFPIEEYKQPEGISKASIAWVSNKKPTGDSPKVIWDIFAPWQLPKEWDDIFIKKKICKLNGLLANDDHPEELTEEKTFANVHSEVPDNPNWETPVLAWAKANGYTNYPPQEYCSEHSNKQRPEITFNSPKDKSTVAGEISVEVQISSVWGLKTLNFYLDGTQIKKFTSPPFSFSLQTSLYKNGEHTLKAKAVDELGLSSEKTINLNFNNTTPEVLNLNASLYNTNSVLLKWDNPANISYLKIYRSIYPENLGVLIKDNYHGESYLDTSLSANTYYFTVRTVNSKGEESVGKRVSITIP